MPLAPRRSPHRKRSRHPALALTLLALGGPLHASESDTHPLGDTLTGDWLGVRSALKDHGLDFTVVYTSETAYNPRGGLERSALYTDQLSFGFAFDLEKLLKLSDARFQISITDRNGHNLSGNQNLGTLQQVQELYGRGQTWLITQFWYRQTYFHHTVDWKIGRMTVGEDFASFSCEFMNLTFCGAPPGNIVGNYWYNWPISQWASRVRVALGGFGYAQVGGYVADPNYLQQRYAFTLAQPPGATGALIPVELGWLPHLGAAQLPGSYRVGAWDNTSRTADVFENTLGRPLLLDGGVPRSRNGAYGGYALHATHWLMLRPNFQYIHQPGGVINRTDDIVLGLKAIVSL
jgi:porin